MFQPTAWMKLRLSTFPLAVTLGLLGFYAGQQVRGAQRISLTALEQEVLSHFSFTTIVDGATGQEIKTLRVSDVNFQIVNGAGATHAANGAGNLILGYAEDAAFYRDRNGSHNMCIGDDNTWRGTGGIVGGTMNEQKVVGRC